MRLVPSAALALMIGLGIGPAAATLTTHLRTIFAECQTQLGLGKTECTCVNDRVAAAFEDIEIELIAARISENMVEVERLRETLAFPQRFGVFVEATALIEECADGAPTRNPL